MINYFLNNASNLNQDIKFFVNELKTNIYEEKFLEYDLKVLLEKFEIIHNFSIETNNEKLANSNFIFKQYVYLFICLSKFLKLLEDKNFEKSWSFLQDCFDKIGLIKKYVDDKFYDLIDLENLLNEYEKLYPYKVFMSMEMVVEKAHCSICGKSKLNFDCEHITGELYWGKISTKIVDKIKEVQGVALVENPFDKRCIIKTDLFPLLEFYLSKRKNYMCHFKVYNKIIPAKFERNKKCFCDSGIKYKRCCINSHIETFNKQSIVFKDNLNFYYF